MTDNLKIILDEFEKHKGEFVITNDGRVERLVAIGSDEYDYYYVMYDGRRFSWQTCVGWFTPLKNKIDDKYYNEFKRLADLNHRDQLNQWNAKIKNLDLTLEVQKHKSEMLAVKGSDKFLTEVCWQIN